jgi:hypothetical protein
VKRGPARVPRRACVRVNCHACERVFRGVSSVNAGEGRVCACVLVSERERGREWCTRGNFFLCACSCPRACVCVCVCVYVCTQDPVTRPRPLLLLPGLSASAIAAGGYHTCAIVSGGGVMCWGLNYYGQLGIGSTDPQTSPVTVPGARRGIARAWWRG